MIIPKIREIKEALISFFTKPYTTKFPATSFVPEEGYRGFPEYDVEMCIGCGACEQVCTASAIEITDNIIQKKRTLSVNYFSCVNCGQCEENCTTEKGIMNKNTLYSFSSPDKGASEHFNTIEKDLVICEACGEIIGCRDHLKYIKRKLGPKAFAHPNLLLNTQSEITELPSYSTKSILRREDYIKELCPKCRHKVVVKDEF